MSYPINAYLSEQNHYRFHAAEQHYIDQLEARGGLIRIENVVVDAEQLVLRAFRCDTRWCMRTVERNGTRTLQGSCCTDLEVDVTPTEVERLRELGRLALERLEFGPRDPLDEAARRMAEGKFTEVTENGDTAIVHMRSQRCALGWLTREGVLNCAINSLCYALELPLTRYKPDPCYLFPLHMVEHAPGQHFITVVCPESHKAVGADGFVARLKCVRKPMPGAPPAFLALKGEIIHCFGKEFFSALAAATIPVLERAGMTEQAGAARAELEVNGGRKAAR